MDNNIATPHSQSEGLYANGATVSKGIAIAINSVDGTMPMHKVHDYLDLMYGHFIASKNFDDNDKAECGNAYLDIARLLRSIQIGYVDGKPRNIEHQ